MAETDDQIAQVLKPYFEGTRQRASDRAYDIVAYALAINKFTLNEKIWRVELFIAALLVRNATVPYCALWREASHILDTTAPSYNSYFLHSLRSSLGHKRKKWKAEGIE